MQRIPKHHGLVMLIVLFASSAQAQQTMHGVSKGKGKLVNFSAIAAREKIQLQSVTTRKMPPVETLEEEEETLLIHNKVPHTVFPFQGKQTVITTKEPSTLQQVEGTCKDFNALDDDNSTSPPDVNGAVGFDHLMVTLNTQVSIQNKQGGAVSTISLVGFWKGLGGHTDIYDPKIVYDPYDKRWFFVCCATRDAAGSALLLGVSQTADPTGGWITYTIDADPANLYWFDYPSLGFNKNWITVGGYMFDITGKKNTPRSRIWVIDKSVVYAAPSNINVTYFDRTDYFHIVPAVTYDAYTNTEWLTSVFNNDFNNRGYLQLFSLTGTQSAPAFNLVSVVDVGSAWSGSGINGPQQGSAIGLNLGDNRILQSTYRSGVLWVANNAFLPATAPTTCVAQIISINTSTNLAIENIRTAANADGSLMEAYPSITVNANQDIFFGYSTFRNNAYVTSTISYRRNGQPFYFYYYKAGEDWYVKLVRSVNRWGDYSSTFIDPEDDITAWTIQEYARPRVGGTSYWGTWWAKICPGTCSDNFALSLPYNNVMRKYEANFAIVSSAQVQNNSNIKYDAGTKITLSNGFKVVKGNKFHAYIEGCGGAQ